MLVLLNDLTVDLGRSPLRHGAGLFETLPVRDGAPLRLGRHLDRLAAGAAFLGLEAPPPADAVAAFARAHTAMPGLGRGVLRLLAAGGDLRVWAEPFDPGPAGPVRAGLAQSLRRLSSHPLNRFKTTSYLDNLLLQGEAERRGLFEVVALNECGALTDGGRTTLCVVSGDRLLTPPVTAGALPGVARAELLAAGLAQEADLRVEDLAAAPAACLVNALRGVLPLAAFDQRPLDPAHPLLAEAARTLG